MHSLFAIKVSPPVRDGRCLPRSGCLHEPAHGAGGTPRSAMPHLFHSTARSYSAFSSHSAAHALVRVCHARARLIPYVAASDDE